MSLHHIWVNGEVVSVDEAARLVPQYASCLCVDTGMFESPMMRYGWYDANGKWKHVPFEDFPAEFKTHLLLLGVG